LPTSLPPYLPTNQVLGLERAQSWIYGGFLTLF
ncbi:hypothetical protein L8106_25165, partial [Lyngbya sp. PCC 8106]